MYLQVIVRHRHSRNKGNIIFDGAYSDWIGAIPRKGEFIEVSKDLKEAYKLPENLNAFVQDVIWDFSNKSIIVNADI